MNFLFILMGIILTVVGIVAVSYNSFWLCWAMLFTGVSVVLVSLLGVWGAPASEKPGRKWILILYFFLNILVIMFIGFFSLVCFISYDLLVSYVMNDYASFETQLLFKSMYTDEEHISDFVTQVATYLFQFCKYVGIVGIVTCVLMMLGLVVSSSILGIRTIIYYVLSFQNTILLVMGIAMSGFGIYILVDPLIDLGEWMPILMILIGIFIFISSLFGCVGICSKSKMMLFLYVIVQAILVIACCALAIGAFVFIGDISSSLASYVTLFRKLFPDLSEMSDADVEAVVQNWVQGYFKLVAVAAIVFGLFLLWSLLAALYMIFKYKNEAQEMQWPQGLGPYAVLRGLGIEGLEGLKGLKGLKIPGLDLSALGGGYGASAPLSMPPGFQSQATAADGKKGATPFV